MGDFYSPQITLIDKNTVAVTPVPVDGDASLGNLTQYRMHGRYSDTINDTTKNGTLVLRCPDGLFQTKEPVLSDEMAKSRYLVQVLLSQGNNTGQLFRFEISKCTIEKGEKGHHCSLELTAYDIRLEEFVDSENLILKNPKEALKQRVINFTTGRDLSSVGSLKLTFNDVNNLLPESPNQDYTPTKPIPTKKLLMDIINRTSRPETVGSTNEDWYYEVTPQADTESFRLYSNRMGAVDSGVMLAESDYTILRKVTGDIDNTKWKNIIIARGTKGAHSLPMNFCKKTSEILHDRSVPDSPDASPLTSNAEDWRSAIPAGSDPPEGYAGFFNDFNIVNSAYERTGDEYADVSLKDVIDHTSDPPASPLHGQRYLVNNGTGLWENQNNRIAQWNSFDGVWHFSDDPVIHDSVYLRSLGRRLRFDGTVWQNDWTLDSKPGQASAFHPIEQISIVPNRSGVTKAIQFKFNWNAFDTINLVQDVADILGRVLEVYAKTNHVTRFLTSAVDSWTGGTASEFLATIGKAEDFVKNAIGVGHQNNLASRWAGFSVLLPFSSFYNSYLDFNNLDCSQITRKKGWNQGKDSEDLGNIRSVVFWCRMSYLTHENLAVNGRSEIPMIFWFRDVFDRIVYKEFSIRSHDVWQRIELSVNDSSWQLYDQRIGELWVNVFGYTLPFGHHIRQRELTGVQFDWRYVREMGCFTKESYNKHFFYIGVQDSFFESFQEHLAQAGSHITSMLPEIDLERTIVDHVNLAIDDLHFGKDAYVTTSAGTETEPRMKMVDISEQHDYQTLEHLAQRVLAREQYHPQNHVIECVGDVRIKAGQKLVLKSNEEDVELVPTRVDHIDDSTGYHCVVHGIRRFVA